MMPLHWTWFDYRKENPHWKLSSDLHDWMFVHTNCHFQHVYAYCPVNAKLLYSLWLTPNGPDQATLMDDEDLSNLMAILLIASASPFDHWCVRSARHIDAVKHKNLVDLNWLRNWKRGAGDRNAVLLIEQVSWKKMRIWAICKCRLSCWLFQWV